MEKDKVQNDKVRPDDEISNEDLDKVAGGRRGRIDEDVDLGISSARTLDANTTGKNKK